MQFKTPIVVEPGLLGRYRILTGPQDALVVLTGRWPETESPQYLKAIEKCEQALGGEIPAHAARASVVAAARAAKVLVTPDVSMCYTAGSIDLAREAIQLA